MFDGELTKISRCHSLNIDRAEKSVNGQNNSFPHIHIKPTPSRVDVLFVWVPLPTPSRVDVLFVWVPYPHPAV